MVWGWVGWGGGRRGVHVKGKVLAVIVAPGVNEEAHFVPRLCEKVTAQEERPQAAAAGRLEGGSFLPKQEVAG